MDAHATVPVEHDLTKDSYSGEESSKLSRIFGNLVGYGTVAATIAVLIIFLIVPVGNIVVKAFIHDGTFTLDYFRLLFSNPLQSKSI